MWNAVKVFFHSLALASLLLVVSCAWAGDGDIVSSLRISCMPKLSPLYVDLSFSIIVVPCLMLISLFVWIILKMGE